MTPIPGHRLSSPAASGRARLALLYLRYGVETPARCPCLQVAECDPRKPVGCEGDIEVMEGKVWVRL